MEKETKAIIKVENVSKVFKLPHEKLSTVKQHFVNIFNPKSYEKFRALDDVSFEIKKGEFFGLIGANGSGKSTLLKILAGIYQPTSGKVTINGSLSPFIELGVGFNPELTARENIYLNAAILGMSRKQTDSKFDEIVKFSELENFLDQKLKNFSSGMQVRLAFSIAIQNDPEILLVDEVLAVGDVLFQRKCFDKFKEFKAKGKTVVFVSHNLGSIEEFSDRVAYLSNGRVIGVGETGKVMNMYQRDTMDNRGEYLKGRGQGNRWGSGEIIFNSLQILDSKGKEVNLLESGKDYNFVFNFKVKKSVRPINIGIGVYSEKDEYCFGVNTKMDKFDVVAQNKIILRVNKLPLNRGEYYYNVVIFGLVETQPYDLIGKVGKFVVDSKTSQRGVSILSHTWSEL